MRFRRETEMEEGMREKDKGRRKRGKRGEGGGHG